MSVVRNQTLWIILSPNIFILQELSVSCVKNIWELDKLIGCITIEIMAFKLRKLIRNWTYVNVKYIWNLTGAVSFEELDRIIRTMFFKNDFNQFQCKKCDYLSGVQTNVINHVESKHVETPGVVCELCQKHLKNSFHNTSFEIYESTLPKCSSLQWSTVQVYRVK